MGIFGESGCRCSSSAAQPRAPHTAASRPASWARSRRSALTVHSRCCRAPCRSAARPNRAARCPRQRPPPLPARWPRQTNTQPAWPAAGRSPASARGGRGSRHRRVHDALQRWAYGARRARLKVAALRAARSNLARGLGPASRTHRIRSCWQKPNRICRILRLSDTLQHQREGESTRFGIPACGCVEVSALWKTRGSLVTGQLKRTKLTSRE